jgi:nitroreductase
MLGDNRIEKNISCDHGIASQSILLGAIEKGFGGCIIASVDKKRLRKEFAIDDHYEILLVIALGKPRETVVINEINEEDDIQYWRDENMVHHVPKRKLEDIILNL